ncbi:MAG: hypothetical protein I3275_04845 [Candidatus Moeniiplasma glomeromycotorum]|nr:hypothetical protein [Candidatus Moeniiplasma glomeromycotorum]
MVSPKKIVNNKKKIKVEGVKVDAEEKLILEEIIKKFKQYRKVLFLLILGYIVCYLVWVGVSKLITDYFEPRRFNGNVLWVVILAVIIQGLLFCLDGYVNSLIKSPFSQMNQKINHSKLLSPQEQDELTFRNTNSNENCKETLKKFGIMQISTELVMVFIRNSYTWGESKFKYERLMVIAYLIPLGLVIFDIWRVHKKLKKIKNRVAHLEKSA